MGILKGLLKQPIKKNILELIISDTEVGILDYLLLEDGSHFLFKDGSKLILSESHQVSTTYVLLEDGAHLLFEDGSKMMLKQDIPED